MKKIFLSLCFLSLFGFFSMQAQNFKLNTKSGHFQNKGVDVMAFDDISPEGHQSVVSIIMWQQVELVMGGGSSHYMFLVLAAQQI